MNFNYNSQLSDDEEDNEVNYVLFLSTLKCRYSKKILKLMKEKKFKQQMQQKIQNNTFQIFDVVELYKAHQPIPNYIKSVPILVTSDPVTNEVIDIINDGNEVYKWIFSNMNKGAYSNGISYGSKINYSCRSGGLSFDPTKIKGSDGYADPSQFLEPIEPKGNKKIGEDISAYDEEYKKVSGELGLHHQERFKTQGNGGNNDEQVPQRTAVGGSHSNRGGFASVSSKKKKSTGKIGAYNS